MDLSPLMLHLVTEPILDEHFRNERKTRYLRVMKYVYSLEEQVC